MCAIVNDVLRIALVPWFFLKKEIRRVDRKSLKVRII